MALKRKGTCLPAAVLCLTLCAVLLGVPKAGTAGDTVFQYATIDALLAGLYDGDLTMGALKAQGGFGLGTLNGLDGELVVLDGTGYHAAAGGRVDVPGDDAMVPFAVVVSFDPESTLKLGSVDSMDALNRAVLKALPSRNVFYAIRIDTRFDRVKTRAIPKQAPPYVPLAEAVKEQVVTPFTGPGTLVGFYSPPFVKGVNVPGFHWHFLTEDRTGGGHVLDCAFKEATANMDTLRGFTVMLPGSGPFDRIDLSGDKGKELHAVEKDPAGKQ